MCQRWRCFFTESHSPAKRREIQFPTGYFFGSERQCVQHETDPAKHSEFADYTGSGESERKLVASSRLSEQRRWGVLRDDGFDLPAAKRSISRKH